jgi:hypothetical protein
MEIHLSLNCRCGNCQLLIMRGIAARFMRPQLFKQIHKAEASQGLILSQRAFDEAADNWLRTLLEKAPLN